jgi:hypothetical protein
MLKARNLQNMYGPLLDKDMLKLERQGEIEIR